MSAAGSSGPPSGGGGLDADDAGGRVGLGAGAARVAGSHTERGEDPASPSWIDAHCHIQDGYLEGDGSLDATVAAACAAGVIGLVCVGTDVTTSLAALAVATTRTDVPAHADGAAAAGAAAAGELAMWATVGLHPHESAAGTDALAAMARERVLNGDPVVAIGECGLDYHYDHADRAVQRNAFADQVALAAELDLALVVHTRQAWDDTLAILRAEGPPPRTVIHCFTGGPEEARRCLDVGAYLSFSGIVTFKNAADIRDAVVLCPADRLLVETDAPFLAPVPFRGRTNQPAWVAVVGESIAAIRSTPVPVVAASTVAATRQAFAIR